MTKKTKKVSVNNGDNELPLIVEHSKKITHEFKKAIITFTSNEHRFGIREGEERRKLGNIATVPVEGALKHHYQTNVLEFINTCGYLAELHFIRTGEDLPFYFEEDDKGSLDVFISDNFSNEVYFYEDWCYPYELIIRTLDDFIKKAIKIANIA